MLCLDSPDLINIFQLSSASIYSRSVRLEGLTAGGSAREASSFAGPTGTLNPGPSSCPLLMLHISPAAACHASYGVHSRSRERSKSWLVHDFAVLASCSKEEVRARRGMLARFWFSSRWSMFLLVLHSFSSPLRHLHMSRFPTASSFMSAPLAYLIALHLSLPCCWQ